MAPKKRPVGDSPRKRAPKKSKVDLAPAVVESITKAEAIPDDLRTLMGTSLAAILNTYKADRHAFEHEVVAQAEKALGEALAELSKKHADALEVQNAVIAPAEHAKRTQAKKDAEQGFEEKKKELDSKKEAQQAAKKAVQEAQGVLKAAEKEIGAVEKQIQAQEDKKKQLTDVLEGEFALLRDGTSSTPQGKKALSRLTSIGKEFKLDSTMMTTIPMSCKKEPSARSEFEHTLFEQLQSAINKQVDALTMRITELEPAKGEKMAAVEQAKETVAKAEAALQTAAEELSTAQAASKEANKAVAAADANLYDIWNDMKKACDHQDALAKELAHFKDVVQPRFDKLKENEPEPEPEEPEKAEETAEDAPMAEEVATETAPQEAGVDAE